MTHGVDYPSCIHDCIHPCTEYEEEEEELLLLDTKDLIWRHIMRSRRLQR
jgi:hypothetical protein